MDVGNPGYNGRERSERRTVDGQRRMVIETWEMPVTFRNRYIHIV
jgi:hypothetical protein